MQNAEGCDTNALRIYESLLDEGGPTEDQTVAGASEGIYRAGGPTANENNLKKKNLKGSIRVVGGGTWLLLALNQMKQFS